MTKKTPDLSFLIGKQMDIYRRLGKESDIAVALICSAYIDDILENLLKGYFVNDGKLIDGLFTPNGALGTHSSKISIAYAIGLLPTNIYKDLEQMRKIRNEFAHSFHRYDDLTFSSSPIIEHCKNLNVTKQIEDAFMEKRNMILQIEPRDRFILSASTIISELGNIAQRQQHTKPTDDYIMPISL